jgi:hypothetical protein
MIKELMTSRRFAPLFWLASSVRSLQRQRASRTRSSILLLYKIGGDRAGARCSCTLAGALFIAPYLRPVGARRRTRRPLRQIHRMARRLKLGEIGAAA